MTGLLIDEHILNECLFLFTQFQMKGTWNWGAASSLLYVSRCSGVGGAAQHAVR